MRLWPGATSPGWLGEFSCPIKSLRLSLSKFRNTDFTRQFLYSWADYAHYRFGPYQGGYGTDNAAVHMTFLTHFCANCTIHLVDHCYDMWRRAHNYPEILYYTSCARAVLGERNLFVADNGLDRALMVTDSGLMWARDGWLTGDQWSPPDFILHGWQEPRRDRPVYGHWHSPLVDSEAWHRLDMETVCQSEGEAHTFWPYKDSFMRDDEWVRRKLHAWKVEMKMRFLGHMEDIFDLL